MGTCICWQLCSMERHNPNECIQRSKRSFSNQEPHQRYQQSSNERHLSNLKLIVCLRLDEISTNLCLKLGHPKHQELRHQRSNCLLKVEQRSIRNLLPSSQQERLLLQEAPSSWLIFFTYLGRRIRLRWEMLQPFQCWLILGDPMVFLPLLSALVRSMERTF
jgi:hypothetical protein